MRKKFLLCGLAGLAVAFCQMLGMILGRMETGTPDGRFLLLHVLPAGVLWGAASACFCFLFQKAGSRFYQSGRAAEGKWRNPFLYWLVILLCWMPCYLAYFPAIYSYDGEPQLIQYTTRAFDNHHPILHTLILGWCYDLGQFLQKGPGIMLDGMAVYAFLQMLLLSGAFAFCIRYFIRRRVSKKVLALAAAWFCFFPVHPLMAVSTTKDTCFTAFFVFVFVLLTEFVQNESFGGRRRAAVFFGALLCMMLFRKNGVYLAAGAALVLAAVFFGYMVKKEKRSRFYGCLLGLTVLGIAAFFVCDRGLMALTEAKQGEAAEALSVPLQQLARTYKSNQDSMTQEELAAVFAYIPAEGLNNYRPYISDGVKQYFDNEKFAEDPAGFFKIWLHLLKRYPGSYITAFLYHTMGCWYPSDVSHSRVYQDWWRDRTGYFITDAVPVFAGDFVKKENLLPGVRNLYESIATDCVHQRFLLTELLFSPAVYCLAVVFVYMVLLFSKRRKLLIPYSMVFVNFLTVLAGPCVLVRYVYPFMALFPLLVSFLWESRPDGSSFCTKKC